MVRIFKPKVQLLLYFGPGWPFLPMGSTQ